MSDSVSMYINGLKWWLWEFDTRKVIKENGGKLPALDKLQQMWVDANKYLEISDYYKPSLERRMFRPPFIQFYECTNILIENVKIINSPFWTINPAFCDNVTIHGVTINNPSSDPKGPNTDGINPSSCRNVRISDCFISVGDDCITIKSGRDADGRKYGKACENITITNCIMLSGHGGVVIGSEMSGGVKRVAISNCVFDGTNAGIRLKASRGRGGVVEDIRVDNIVMKNIQGDAFIFDLFYDRLSKVEPVSERTPIFRNIHLSNVTGNDIKRIGYIKGIVSGFPKDACFLETGGIGYRIFISERTRSLLHIGEEARLLTYMAVREDAILLYGFPEQDEYDLFLILISVSKIGPKVAIGILSSMTPDAFVRAIVSRNVTALTKLPGIGKKTAERLVVELKDKVANLEMEGVSMDGEDIAAADSGLIGQASLALSGLGYSSEEVLPLLKKLAPDHPALSDLIGAVLREFGKAQG